MRINKQREEKGPGSPLHHRCRFRGKNIPPFDLKNEMMAGIIALEIKKSVDMAAGKKLKEVDDILAESLFEEGPPCGD